MGLTNNNKFLLAFAGQWGPSAEINRQLCRAVLWTRCFRNMRRLYYLPMAGPGAKEPRFPVIVDSEHRYEKWTSQPASQPAVCLVWRSHIPAINYYLIITIHIVARTEWELAFSRIYVGRWVGLDCVRRVMGWLNVTVPCLARCSSLWVVYVPMHDRAETRNTRKRRSGAAQYNIYM